MITEDLVTKIENSNYENAKEILFEHLMRNADVAALRVYCKKAIDTNGVPNMQTLGRKMLNDLPPEGVRAASPLHAFGNAHIIKFANNELTSTTHSLHYSSNILKPLFTCSSSSANSTASSA